MDISFNSKHLYSGDRLLQLLNTDVFIAGVLLRHSSSAGWYSAIVQRILKVGRWYNPPCAPGFRPQGHNSGCQLLQLGYSEEIFK
jgi:hypothetical protein